MNTKEQRSIKSHVSLTNLLNQTFIKHLTKKESLETLKIKIKLKVAMFKPPILTE